MRTKSLGKFNLGYFKPRTWISSTWLYPVWQNNVFWFPLSSRGHYVWRKSDMTWHCRGCSPSSKLYISDCWGEITKYWTFSRMTGPLWLTTLTSLSGHSSLRTPEELSFLETVSITLILVELWPVIQSKAQQWPFLYSNHTDFCLFWLFAWGDVGHIMFKSSCAFVSCLTWINRKGKLHEWLGYYW